MTQTKASRKRGHPDMEEEGGRFLPSSKRRDFNFSGPTLQTNGHSSDGHDESHAMHRQQLLQAGGSDAYNSASPKMLTEGGVGSIVSPSTHPSQLQLMPPHHQQHHHHHHHHPGSPTSPHNGHGGPITLLNSNGQINFQASGSSCGGIGMPNIPVSPAHSPQGFSNFSSFSNFSRYDDINRILREAHFDRISRINGVELSPNELHL